MEERRMLEEIQFNVNMRIRNVKYSDGFDELGYNELLAQQADLDGKIGHT